MLKEKFCTFVKVIGTYILQEHAKKFFQTSKNSQVFVILINIMQLQHMRVFNQFQNGNLPLNLVKQKRQRQ